MSQNGRTTTSQMPQGALVLRFLARTQADVTLMRACLPDSRLPIEPLALVQLERMAAKLVTTSEAFGFPEIAVIAGSIELLSQVGAGRTVRDRLELRTRLAAQLSALESHLEYELAERNAYDLRDEMPMTAWLRGSAG